MFFIRWIYYFSHLPPSKSLLRESLNSKELIWKKVLHQKSNLWQINKQATSISLGQKQLFFYRPKPRLQKFVTCEAVVWNEL